MLKPQNSKLWYETVGDWCDRWTKTNLYAAGSRSNKTVNAAPVAGCGEGIGIDEDGTVEAYRVA